MTIHRQKTESFDVPIGVLDRHIRKILDADPDYAWTTEDDHGRHFTTEVRTARWVQGFVVTILLEAGPIQTAVTVHITSEPWVTADPVDIFNRYVSRFFSALRYETDQTLLRAAEPPRSPDEDLLRPTHRRSDVPPQQLLRSGQWSVAGKK